MRGGGRSHFRSYLHERIICGRDRSLAVLSSCVPIFGDCAMSNSPSQLPAHPAGAIAPAGWAGSWDGELDMAQSPNIGTQDDNTASERSLPQMILSWRYDLKCERPPPRMR